MKTIVIAAAAWLALGSAAIAEPGAWTVKEMGSSPEGGSYFVAQVLSATPLINTAQRPEKAAFQIRCQADGLFVTVFWPDFVVGETYHGDRVDVSLALDGGAARTTRMAKSDKAVLALGKSGFNFVKPLVKGTTLSVQTPDFHGGQTAVFPIAGLDRIFARLSDKGCS